MAVSTVSFLSHLWNDLLCIEWDVNPYALTHCCHSAESLLCSSADSVLWLVLAVLSSSVTWLPSLSCRQPFQTRLSSSDGSRLFCVGVSFCDCWVWTLHIHFVHLWLSGCSCHVLSHIHCVSKKVPTFKLSVTLSYLNLHCWKTLKFATKPMQYHPPHLRHVATLPWEIINSNFLQIFSRYGRKFKQIAFFVALTLLLIHKF